MRLVVFYCINSSCPFKLNDEKRLAHRIYRLLVDGELCGGSEFEPHLEQQLYTTGVCLMSADLQFSRHSSRGWLSGKTCAESALFLFVTVKKRQIFRCHHTTKKAWTAQKMMPKDEKFYFLSRNTRFKTTAPIITELLKTIYTIRRLRTHGLSHINLVCPVTTLTQGRGVFFLFSLMVKSGFELGTPW